MVAKITGKRAASKENVVTSPVAAPAKKQKTDPMLEGLVAAIEMADDLTESCREMLIGMIPSSFGIPSDVRQRQQHQAVEMIGEIIESIQAKMQKDIEAETSNVSSAESVKADLEEKVVDANSRLSEIADEVKAKSMNLASVSKELLQKRTLLNAAQDAQRKGDATYLKVKDDKEGFTAAIEEHLKPLLGDVDGTKATVHYKALLPFITKLGVEEALTTALPGTCCKDSSERTGFDGMVFQQIEQRFTDRLKQLEAATEAEAPAAEKRAAAFATAKEEHDRLKSEQQRIAKDLADKQVLQRDAEAAVKAACAAVVTNEPEYQRSTAARDEKTNRLKQFIAYNVECYNFCRDRQSKRAESEVAGEAKTVDEQAVTDAPVATAGA